MLLIHYQEIILAESMTIDNGDGIILGLMKVECKFSTLEETFSFWPDQVIATLTV